MKKKKPNTTFTHLDVDTQQNDDSIKSPSGDQVILESAECVRSVRRHQHLTSEADSLLFFNQNPADFATKGMLELV